MHMRQLVLAAVAALSAAAAMADRIDPDFEARVLDAAAKVRAAGLRPMAFWDCDGTIIRGDVCTGAAGRAGFSGLIEAGILAGFSKIYSGAEGYVRFRDVDYPTLRRCSTWLAWPYVGQLFEGTDAKTFDDFAHRHYRDTMSKWYFRHSYGILRRLEAAGIENHVISGSPEYFVRGLDETTGLPADHIHGLGNVIRDGVITHEITYPVPDAKGKTRILKRLMAERGGAAVAAFGNSYPSDGDFMLFTVTNALPGGAKGQALMINGMKPDAALKPHFTCVELEEVLGKTPESK